MKAIGWIQGTKVGDMPPVSKITELCFLVKIACFFFKPEVRIYKRKQESKKENTLSTKKLTKKKKVLFLFFLVDFINSRFKPKKRKKLFS